MQDINVDLSTLTPLTPEIISRQATINIGTIGHVAHGKSTLVRAISGVNVITLIWLILNRPCATTRNASETLPLSWVMRIRSCTSVQLVNHPTASSLSGLRRRTRPSAPYVNRSCSSLDMCRSLIAQGTTCSWLPCSLVPQSWTLHCYWLLVINPALSLRLQSTWQQLRSWSSSTWSSFRTRLIWSLESPALLSVNTKISRNSWPVQWLRTLQ